MDLLCQGTSKGLLNRSFQETSASGSFLDEPFYLSSSISISGAQKLFAVKKLSKSTSTGGIIQFYDLKMK
jgi:hypothetical protein